MAVKADWSRRFNDPIPPPKGRQLVTLKDAGTYITKLPKAEHETAEWQAAMEALILVATSGHEREVRPAEGCHPTLSGFPDFRRRGCCSRPGNGLPQLVSGREMGASGM